MQPGGWCALGRLRGIADGFDNLGMPATARADRDIDSKHPGEQLVPRQS